MAYDVLARTGEAFGSLNVFGLGTTLFLIVIAVMLARMMAKDTQRFYLGISVFSGLFATLLPLNIGSVVLFLIAVFSIIMAEIPAIIKTQS